MQMRYQLRHTPIGAVRPTLRRTTRGILANASGRCEIGCDSVVRRQPEPAAGRCRPRSPTRSCPGRGARRRRSGPSRAGPARPRAGPRRDRRPPRSRPAPGRRTPSECRQIRANTSDVDSAPATESAFSKDPPAAAQRACSAGRPPRTRRWSGPTAPPRRTREGAGHERPGSPAAPRRPPPPSRGSRQVGRPDHTGASAAMTGAAAAACSRPTSSSGTSACPCARPAAFQAVRPWRSRIERAVHASAAGGPGCGTGIDGQSRHSRSRA